MERTKYTPKRLLSLLLALIMLLGMLPTATLAAGTGDEPVVTPYVKTFEGLTFEFTLDVPERPFFRYGEKRVDVHYTITKSNDNNMVSELTEFKNGEHAPVNVTAKASDEKYSAVTHEVYNKKGEIVKVFDPGTVLASGNFTYIQGTADGDVDANGKLEFVFRAKFIAAWNDQDGLQHSTADYQTGGSVDVAKIRVSNLQAGYSVSYNDGGYTGAAGIPKEVEYTTGDNALTQSYTLPSVTPTLAGCTFKGWRSNEWEKTDSDGNELTGDTALFQPGDTVEKVPSDTVLTAVWDENASEHKVEFYHNFPNGSDETLFTTVHVADGEGAENPGAPYKHPEGYIFKDWCVKAEVGGKVTLTPYDFAAPVTEDIKLYADWTQVTEETTHSVKFVRNNATDGSATNWPNDLTGAEGEKVKIPWTTPTAEGKTFLGWSTTENATAAETDYARGKEVTLGDTDTSLYAVWKADTVTIHYPAHERPYSGSEYDGVWISETGTKTNVTRGSKQTFTVRLDDGYDPQYLLVIKNTKKAEDTNFEGSGRGLNYVGSYTPQHWTEGQQKYTEYYYEYYADEDVIQIHIDLPQKIKYTVTLPVSDKVDVAFTAPAAAAAAKSTTVNYGDEVKFTVTARPGYTVKGVYVNGEKKGNAAGEYTISNITANQTVTVDVAAIVLRNVTYVLDGAQMATQQVESGAAFTLLSAPTKTGYTWNKVWYTDNTYATQYTGTTTDKDLVLYGRYTPKSYTISYDLNATSDATVSPATIASTTKTYGQAVVLSTVVPTRTGYDFLGWAKDVASKTAVYTAGATMSEEITENTTLYAVWAKKTYTITLQSGSGYTISTDQATVVKHGETFAFTVTVDGAYAATEPTVTATPVGRNRCDADEKERRTQFCAYCCGVHL